MGCIFDATSADGLKPERFALGSSFELPLTWIKPPLSRSVSRGGKADVLTSSLDSEVSFKSFSNGANTNAHRQSDFLQPNPWGLVHHYLEGELRMEANLRARDEIANFETRDLMLTFDHVSAEEIAILDSHSNRRADLKASASNYGTDKVQFPMPVDSCPVVEDDKGLAQIKFLPIESAGCTRVTLHTLHDGSYVARNTFHAPHRLFEVTGVLGYDELPFIFVGGRIASEFKNGGIVNARIKRAPELIQHLAKLEAEWENPFGFNWFKEEFACPVAVHLWPRGVNLVCVKGVPEVYERLAVDFRSINAIPARLEWGTHAES